jgi:hypothetical protein
VRPVDSTGKRDAAGRSVDSADALVVTLYAVTVWITWREGATDGSVRLDSKQLLTITHVEPLTVHMQSGDFSTM